MADRLGSVTGTGWAAGMWGAVGADASPSRPASSSSRPVGSGSGMSPRIGLSEHAQAPRFSGRTGSSIASARQAMSLASRPGLIAGSHVPVDTVPGSRGPAAAP